MTNLLQHLVGEKVSLEELLLQSPTADGRPNQNSITRVEVCRHNAVGYT